jgi:hypothetical protein
MPKGLQKYENDTYYAIRDSAWPVSVKNRAATRNSGLAGSFGSLRTSVSGSYLPSKSKIPSERLGAPLQVGDFVRDRIDDVLHKKSPQGKGEDSTPAVNG